MTEKELRDDIIVKMLDYRDESNVGIKEFCKTKNIKFSSDEQQERVFHYLKDNGYINAQFYINGDGYFSITSEGIDYAESLIAQSLVETTKLVKENKIEIDDNSLEDLHFTNITQEITSQLYTTKENSTKIVDNSVEACFNVEKLADCYVKLIDRACENEQNNVCMFGIFAPWGRGKTYFFRKVKECINERTDSKAIQYDIVEFNAWKYQETPAIWAYLFETLYNSKDWWFKFRYTIKRIWESISYGLPFLIPIILIILFYNKNIIDTIFDNWKKSLTIIVSILSAIGLILDFISKHYNSAISLIKRYSKGVTFANELGIQAEIEKEITSLLNFWISEKNTVKKKVILYIDDIDRCSETKMTSIIDSLRTVLENAEIRKRLIIVCSIDPDKIIKGIEYKYKTLYENDDKKIHTIAIEQMDKIFLTGIALAPLNNEQLFEYASKLADVNDPSIHYQQVQDKNGVNIMASDGRPVMAPRSTSSPNKMDGWIELNNDNIYKHLKNLINNYKEQLTPRKIRIIYYRILLANNIICNKEDSMITETLIKNIFNLSVGNKIEKSDKADELIDILNMVVPYRYNEENEVSSEVKKGQ
ncbi:P-loop NTPase fold protein [Segatella paludivivens]|uniref:P-loop NTPase fold protein n=1 Tax=Segatella paludivivens TaxID=185294 RepID=UPI0003737FE3|nr:P-loop NTPase fold protein [Segatella paludivivens]